MELFSFFNSSASYRVRIALGLKGLAIPYRLVNIRTGEHRQPAYVEHHNPAASVPCLTDGDLSLGQSLAIIDWLDTHHPEPLLIPDDVLARARALELSYLVACDIHPLNNLRTLKYLRDELSVTAEQQSAWYRHWIAEGMAAVEQLLQRLATQHEGPWSLGKAPSIADCCLIPQIANARRFGCDLSAYTRANVIYEHAMTHPAFIQAAPQNQPDYIAG